MRSTQRWLGGRCSRLDFWRNKRLGHYQEVAGEQGVHMFGERRGAALHVAELLVISGKFCPHVDNPKIHETAASGAAMILRGVHQACADSGALQGRLYR